jgi:hypothetical protein
MILADLNPTLIAPPIYANTGGPMSRTRKERVTSTILGKDDGYIRCPQVIRLGLHFEGEDPVDTIERIVHEEGFRTPNELVDIVQPPVGRLICRPLDSKFRRLRVDSGERTKILKQALMLGLCTAHIYDSSRPVLWTSTSLMRVLELFDPRGFYA